MAAKSLPHMTDDKRRSFWRDAKIKSRTRLATEREIAAAASFAGYELLRRDGQYHFRPATNEQDDVRIVVA